MQPIAFANSWRSAIDLLRMYVFKFMLPLYRKDKQIARGKFTKMIIYLKDKQIDNLAMKNPERRLINSRWLATMCGGLNRFGEIMDMDPPQVSHIIGEKPIRGIGNIITKRIEERFEKEPGWLDQDHIGATSTVGTIQRFAALYENGDVAYREFLDKMVGIYESASDTPDRRQMLIARVPNRRG